MIPEFLIRYWKIELVILLVLMDVLFINLWRSEVKAYAAYRAEIKAMAQAQEAYTTRVVADQKRITEETTHGWKAAVDYLRTRPVGVLSRACAGAVPAVPGTATGADGPGQGPVLTPARIEEDVAEDVLKLNRLQDWVDAQQRIQ